MPEAAIDKHRYALFLKYEIGLTKDFGIPAPARDTGSAKNLNHP